MPLPALPNLIKLPNNCDHRFQESMRKCCDIIATGSMGQLGNLNFAGYFKESFNKRKLWSRVVLLGGVWIHYRTSPFLSGIIPD